MDNEEPIIRIDKLSKRFGKKIALDRVSLEIYPGRIVGLLGSNGAGKSTLLRHIIGLYLPDIGQCTTFGSMRRISARRNLVESDMSIRKASFCPG